MRNCFFRKTFGSLLFISIAPVIFGDTPQKVEATLAREPLPAMVRAAAARRWSMSGFEGPSAVRAVADGDSFVALLHLEADGQETEWLLRFVAEKTLNPGALGSTKSGNKLAMNLTTVGPFSLGQRDGVHAEAAHEISNRILVNEDLLKYGLGDWMFELRKLQTLSRVEVEHLTKVFGAMNEFLRIATNTESGKHALAAVIDKPSVWGMLGHITSPAQFQGNGEGPETDTTVDFSTGAKGTLYHFAITMDIFGTRCANAVFAVTPAVPSLLMSAGVIEMNLSSPKRPKNTLQFKVLSAHLGKGESKDN
jgi:hypothetical protein